MLVPGIPAQVSSKLTSTPTHTQLDVEEGVRTAHAHNTAQAPALVEALLLNVATELTSIAFWCSICTYNKYHIRYKMYYSCVL